MGVVLQSQAVWQSGFRPPTIPEDRFFAFVLYAEISRSNSMRDGELQATRTWLKSPSGALRLVTRTWEHFDESGLLGK